MDKRSQRLSGWAITAATALVIIIGGVIWSIGGGWKSNNPSSKDPSICDSNDKKLPAPELSEGIRGQQFGIDKNVNEETIDQYLYRDDVVYRDMRMLKDPGNYEAIGGDSYLSGFVDGFEIIPYPYIVNVTDLPSEVGNTYTGKTLFTEDKDGNIVANYDESMQILEDLFPKNKTIFLLCGGAGYAGAMKNLLVKLGWDANKIYNVGGYWYYEGDHNIKVKTTRNGETVYDFWKVPYHNIDFSTLHEVKDAKKVSR